MTNEHINTYERWCAANCKIVIIIKIKYNEFDKMRNKEIETEYDTF